VETVGGDEKELDLERNRGKGSVGSLGQEGGGGIVARRYSEAERAELAFQCYRLNLHGLSGREIGKQLGIDHKTAIKLVKEEAERRRDEESHDFQKAVDTYRAIIRRCKEELDSSPSGHAVSQLSHAMISAQNSIDLLLGLRAPTRKEVNVEHRLLKEMVIEGTERLNDEELNLLQLLVLKMSGDLPEEKNVLDLPPLDPIRGLPSGDS
jgi:hypothetical protein